MGFVILVCLFLSACRYGRSMMDMIRHRCMKRSSPATNIVGLLDHQAGWEGSVAGIAYSEFNHHLTGMLVLIIGLSELRQALAMPFWAWTRFLCREPCSQQALSSCLERS